MRRRCALTWMLGLLLSACSGEKSDQTLSPKGERNAPAVEKEVQDEAKPAPGQAEKQIKAKMPGKKIRARAVTEPIEGKNVQSFDVALQIMPSDQVEGSITLAGVDLTVRGIKRGTNLRLWVVGEEDEPSKVRRGYLIGTLEGDEVKGSFAISGNGGEPTFKGTFASAN